MHVFQPTQTYSQNKKIEKINAHKELSKTKQKKTR